MAQVLIADDESDIRAFARMVLERGGYRVVEAATGPAALDLLAREPMDLLLLDLMLPGIDGHSIQMKMAADENLKKIPVIVITALEFTQDMFAKFPQVKAFLPKPFTAIDLERAVRQVVPVPAL